MGRLACRPYSTVITQSFRDLNFVVIVIYLSNPLDRGLPWFTRAVGSGNRLCRGH